MSLVIRRLELVLLYGFHSLFVQTHPEGPHDVDMLRIALRVHDQRHEANALVLRPASFVGKLGIDREDELWSRNASARVHQAAAVSAAFARSNSAAIAGADASTLAAAEARARTRALRGECDLA